MRTLFAGVLLLLVATLGPLVMDHVMTGAPDWLWGLMAAVAGVAGFLLILISDPLHPCVSPIARRHAVTSTLLVFVICGLIGAGSWWFTVVKAHAPQPGVAPKPEAAGAALASQTASALQLYVECWPAELPTAIPPDAEWFVALLFQAQDGTHAPGFKFVPLTPPLGPAGGTMTWTRHTSPLSMVGGMCKVTNYSGTILFAVDLAIRTRFEEAIRTDKTFARGIVTAEHDWSIRLPKVEGQKDRPFIFYIANEAQAYVTVEVLDKTTGVVTGQADRRSVQLIRVPGADKVYLNPNDASPMS